ncbi:MAG: T9SS type A sorting domain-containing protein [Bacteroidota bacterium]
MSADGDIYITGHFLGVSDFDPGPAVAPLTSGECFDAFIAKYSAAGAYQWAVDIGAETECAEAVGMGIALDQHDNVFVTGYYFDFDVPVDFDGGSAVVTADYVSEEDAFVVRYDNEGRFGWALGLGGFAGGMGLRIAANAEGLAHVLAFGCGRVSMGMTGAVLDFPTGCRLFVSTYDQAGFVATSVAQQNETPAAHSLSAVYPNPFSQRAQFMLTLGRAAFVSVGLYDTMGREVRRVHDGYLAGETAHYFEVDGASVPSGVYLLRVEGAGHLTTQRLVITH